MYCSLMEVLPTLTCLSIDNYIGIYLPFLNKYTCCANKWSGFIKLISLNSDWFTLIPVNFDQLQLISMVSTLLDIAKSHSVLINFTDYRGLFLQSIQVQRPRNN